MSDVGLAMIVLLFLLFFIGVMIWHFTRSASMVERWAAENGFQILSREYRWFARGPFWWRTGKGMAVYRVTLRDDAGRVRRAWVRCGGWFLGLLSDKVTVEWD